MGKATFDDGTSSNPKLIAVGAPAAWLWFCGVLYCRRALTDGFIPKVVVPTLAIGLPSPHRHAARLVDARLWHHSTKDGADGYEVHDYLDWNPTKAQVELWRDRDSNRKRRAKAHREGVSDSGMDSESDSEMESDQDSRRIPHGALARIARGAKSVSVSESVSGSDPTREESARETTPPVWRSGPRRADPSQRDLDYHRRHCPLEPFPWAAAACEAGVCVPKYLWPQWARRKPAEELAAMVARWTPQIGGDRPEDFWPRAFASHFGVTAPVTPHGDKTTRTMSAAERLIARQLTNQKAVGDGQ